MPSTHVPAPAALNNIVIASDFSPSSDAAVLWALGIARRNNANVWIVNVVSDTFFSADTQQRAIDDAWREGHRRMTEHFISGRLDGVQSKLLVEHGGVFEVLDRIMQEHHGDLLVLGTRGRSRIGKLLLGSSAESIFRQASYPVLTVGPRSETDIPLEGPRKIMFCTGFSSHSIAAGKLALRLAERQDAQLFVLHVGPETETNREEYTNNAKARLEALIPLTANLTSPPQIIVEFGGAAERILAVADEQRPDLIVLGVRQPESFARRLRWATAYDVVSNAPCPVLTVRSADSGTQVC
jgi:nucleotide-binding universal stress UspA family protein